MKQKALQEVLNAFFGLFTQPFDQDFTAASKAATTSILLSTLPGLRLLGVGGSRVAGEFAASSLVLFLVLTLLTAVFTKQDRKLAIARKLSVMSFWIAATLVVIFAVDMICPDPLDEALRLGIATVSLIPLVCVHMFGNLPLWPALRMTIFLCISTVYLARVAL